MDGADNSHAHLNFFLHCFHNLVSCSTVKSTSWFIQQHSSGISNQFISNGGSFTFSTRKSLHSDTSNHSVLTPNKVKSVNDIVYLFDQVICVKFCSEFSCKHQGLNWSHCFYQYVILLDKCSKFTKILLINNSVVGSDFTI